MNKMLKEMILYVSAISETDPNFGKTKLNKLLFFCDFGAFQQLGASITGVQFVKKQHGPVPEDIDQLLHDMEKNGEIVIRRHSYFGKDQWKVIHLRSADLGVFQPQQISLIHRVVDEHKDRTASAVSELSHDFIGWKVAAMGERIPYETALISSEPLPMEDLAGCVPVAG